MPKLCAISMTTGDGPPDPPADVGYVIRAQAGLPSAPAAGVEARPSSGAPGLNPGAAGHCVPLELAHATLSSATPRTTSAGAAPFTEL
jgi:hypothetical protein